MAINRGAKAAQGPADDEKELQVEADDDGDSEDDTGEHVYPPYEDNHKDKQNKQVIVNKTHRNRSLVESRRRLD